MTFPIDGRVPNEFELPVTPDDIKQLMKKISNSVKHRYEDLARSPQPDKKISKKRR